jgi:uncharacterized protein YecE (DUF72 family)
MKQIRVGFSGWNYGPWRGSFYPKGLVQKRELEFASRQVNSIEINGTFYSLQRPETFQNWYNQVPDDFIFAVKGGQYITHVLRLKKAEQALANFFASGLLCLKQKLGPILWQFPPNVMLKDNRFEKFIRLLPHDTHRASELASRHGAKVQGRAWTEAKGLHRVRHAFEFRHPSFQNPDFIAMMRENNIAIVFVDSGKKSPIIEDVTSDFIYVRLHGEDKRYAKGYTKDAISRWAKRIQSWSIGKQPQDAQCFLEKKPKLMKRDAFIYFGTEAKERSPFDALHLSQRLKLSVTSEPFLTQLKKSA